MNYWWLVSGGIGLLTALVHLIGGQFDVIKPFLRCDLACSQGCLLRAAQVKRVVEAIEKV